MPRRQEIVGKEPTREERRERRLLRREKQRKDNIGRAVKMRAARLQMESEYNGKSTSLKAFAYVGCSGWFYWKWREVYFIPSTCPPMNGFITTEDASIRLNLMRPFIRGRPWRT